MLIGCEGWLREPVPVTSSYFLATVMTMSLFYYAPGWYVVGGADT